MTFPAQLYALALPVAAHIASVDPEVTRFVSRSRLNDTSKEFQTLKTSLEEEMKTYRIAKFKPLKRLASFAEPSLDSSRCVAISKPCCSSTSFVGLVERPPRGQRNNGCRYPIIFPRTRSRPRPVHPLPPRAPRLLSHLNSSIRRLSRPPCCAH